MVPARWSRPHKRAGGNLPPAKWRFKRFASSELIARCEIALRAEDHGEGALIFGRIESGRTCALRLAERDRLPGKRRFDTRVEDIDRETKASHGIPVGVRSYGPVVEAGIAVGTREDDVLSRCASAVAEIAAVDDRVVIPNLRVVPVHRGREVAQPEVLVARARRPGRGQLELAAVDEDAIGIHAQRNHVAAAEQARAGQVAAARVSGGADAIVEVATEVVARASPGCLDVDA